MSFLPTVISLDDDTGTVLADLNAPPAVFAAVGCPACPTPTMVLERVALVGEIKTVGPSRFGVRVHDRTCLTCQRHLHRQEYYTWNCSSIV